MNFLQTLHPIYYYAFVCFAQLLLTVSTAERDVIGQYVFSNENQCRALCWYHRDCASSSYRSSGSVSSSLSSSGTYNCILYKDSGASAGSATTSVDGWLEKTASESSIKNGCRARPCTPTQVCVPTSSISASYACLPVAPTVVVAPTPEPTQCGVPDAVLHGNVSSQGDVANVMCDEGYVASPRGVSVELTCSASSTWTPFTGTCEKYEFFTGETKYKLPWQLEENSGICIQGVFTQNGKMQIKINFGGITKISFIFRYQYQNLSDGIFFNVRSDGVWMEERVLGDDPLRPEDIFSMTLRFLSDKLQLLLDGVGTFYVPLNDILDVTGQPIDVRAAKDVSCDGRVSVEYLNLIEGCQ